MQISPTWTREKELQAQFIGLQQRYEERPETKSFEIIPCDLGMKLKLVSLVSVGSLFEELQRQKMKNVQVCCNVTWIYEFAFFMCHK